MEVTGCFLRGVLHVVTGSGGWPANEGAAGFFHKIAVTAVCGFRLFGFFVYEFVLFNMAV